MATSVQDLRIFLKNHGISKILRDNATKEVRQLTPIESNDAKRLIVVSGNSLFVWNSYDACALHCSLVLPGSSSVADTESGVGEVHSHTRHVQRPESSRISYKRLVCSNPPLFDVDQLLLSPTADYIAVCGQNGVTVMVVPGRLGEPDENKEGIICRCVNVGEQELSHRHNTRILHTAWHPGSDIDSHLALLFSHDLLCIYDILHHGDCTQSISLGDGDPNSDLHSSVFESALGEVAVSFDFGADIPLQRRANTFTESSHLDEFHTVWPIYVLKGNGDVLIAYSDLSKTRRIYLPTSGPLMMYPPAEDNYGTDACSIVCLQSSPETLVISTCAGSLYHCVVLGSSHDDGQQSPSYSLSHRLESPTIQGYIPPKPVSLYVYEVVELEFSLIATSDYSREVIDEFNYPVRLMKDIYTPDRYHCCHAAGVHTVAVTWLQTLSQYCALDKEMGGNFSLNQPSIVEHLICTKPLPTSPNAPIMGLAAMSYHNLGVLLLALTADMTFEILPLSTRYHLSDMSLLSESPRKNLVDSPIKRLRNEPFHKHISKILQRNASNPILKSSTSTSLSQRDCFQLLTRATHFFREEYVLKQNLARDAIDKRIRILKEQKKQQENDSKLLDDSRESLRINAEKIAEKVEDVKTQQQETMERVRVLLRKIQSQVPVLSLAEEKLHHDLGDMGDRLETYSSHINHLEAKYDHQKKQMNLSKNSSTTSPSINSKQTQSIKTVLKQQADEISDLVKNVNQLKVDVNL